MIIKSIALENIRSYVNETINFPEGSVLLSGDIGSGKSTILLALEFALFGPTKKDLPGEALLRKGEKTGSVEIKIDINSKEYVIKRILKNVAGKVIQVSGYIINGEIRKDATAVELKSDILNLLNYPPEMLTKKSLVYRYTVYTPQEEIKAILMEDKETRLDTLRKVFGIDKYKKIRENSSIYAKNLRDRLRFYSGQIIEFDKKQKDLDFLKRQGTDMKLQIEYIRPKIEEKAKMFYKQKNLVEIIDKKLKEKTELRKDIELIEKQIASALKFISQTESDISVLKSEINNLDDEKNSIKIPDSAQFNENLSAARKEIESMEKSRIELIEAIKGAEVRKQMTAKDADSIKKLSNCPVCRQNVSDSHKEEIEKSAKQKADQFDSEILNHTITKRALEENLVKSKDALREIEEEIQKINLKHLNYSNIEKRIAEKSTFIAKILAQDLKYREDVELLNQKKSECCKKLEDLESFKEEHISKEKLLLEDMQKDVHLLEIELAKREKEYETIVKRTSDLLVEINNMMLVKENIKKINSLINWLDVFFNSLMTAIEKQVMLQLYNEFNTVFRSWLKVLIEDPNLQISLDEEFTPLIVQNDHEILLEHMSGGEKTAISLTYRLALNKVINDLLSNINTRDLIILDEPTDGFSNEQLDKVRNVLDQLNLRQVIIVSHESKIESFVDYCIRITKENHVSRVQ